MKFKPKDFVVPSLILHGSAIVLLIILCWKVPTIKTPKEKQFRVNLVQLPTAPPVKTYSPPKRASKPAKKTTKPKPKPKKAVKPKPKPKKTVKPKPKPKKIVKPKPKPKPKVTQKPKRKILPTPKKILEKQKKWVKKRTQKKKKQKIVKRDTNTNTTYVSTWKPKPFPKTKTVYNSPKLKSKDAFKESQQRLKELERSLNQDTSNLKKKMDSYLQASKFTGGASGAQATIINNYFRQSILTAIDKVWMPPSAALVPKKAQCDVAFTLSKNGNVSNVRIVRRSGYSVLDDSAVSAVRQANFPAFPADLNKNSLNVEVPFVCEPND